MSMNVNLHATSYAWQERRLDTSVRPLEKGKHDQWLLQLEVYTNGVQSGAVTVFTDMKQLEDVYKAIGEQLEYMKHVQEQES